MITYLHWNYGSYFTGQAAPPHRNNQEGMDDEME